LLRSAICCNHKRCFVSGSDNFVSIQKMATHASCMNFPSSSANLDFHMHFTDFFLCLTSLINRHLVVLKNCLHLRAISRCITLHPPHFMPQAIYVDQVACIMNVSAQPHHSMAMNAEIQSSLFSMTQKKEWKGWKLDAFCFSSPFSTVKRSSRVH
jgi:hypothetical protein